MLNIQEDLSHGYVWQQAPAEMYLRLWPEDNYTPSFNGIFRWREAQDRKELKVRFENRRSSVPLNAAQYKLWDELRTQFMLDPEFNNDEIDIWTGMTLMPQSFDDKRSANWDQNHVFFAIRNRTKRKWESIVALHYDTYIFAGHWQEREQYLDWRMNSKKMIVNPLL